VDWGDAEKFEAIHTLINTKTVILPSSRAWKVLFGDAEISKREAWKHGIAGFGLPIADSIFLHDEVTPEMSLLRKIDPATGSIVVNVYHGESYDVIFDRWRKNGWIDTLHTVGIGDDNTRAATEMGLKWLKKRPDGDLTIWVDHKIGWNPTSLGHTRSRALPYMVRGVLHETIVNTLKSGVIFVRSLGFRSFASRISDRYMPYHKFPVEVRAVCWVLFYFLVGIPLVTAACLLFKRLRKRSLFFSGLGLWVLVLIVLYSMHLNFGYGAEQKSLYYCADLLRDFGFRYYSIYLEELVPSPAGLHKSRVLPERNVAYPKSFILPEHAINGRVSPLYLLPLRDGSKVLCFITVFEGVVYKIFEEFTPEALDELCDSQSWVVLNPEWVHYPRDVFTAKALDGLGNIEKYYRQKRIWVAPTSRILDYASMRTFLEYRLSTEPGKRIIDITGVRSPDQPFSVPTPEKLRGISFECPGDAPVEVRLAGTPMSKGNVVSYRNGERTVVMFPLD
jgi:hypothetical protein